jgi:hypothetical protein
MVATSRRLAGVAAALILGLFISLWGTSAFAASNATDPNNCSNPKVPVDSISSSCPNGDTTGPTSGGSTTGPADRGGQQASGSGGVQFGQDEEATGWAGPIAKDLGQGVQGQSSDLAKKLKDDGLLPKFEFTRGYLSLYAIMFGLGVVVAVLATMLAAVKVAEARGVDRRIMAQAALVRLLTFSLVGGMVPLLLAELGDLAQSLAGGFFDLAASQLASQLSWLAGALAVGTLASLVVPGGSAVLVGLFLFLLAALLGIWLELAISHYLIFLLGLLIPILYAASINPSWRRGVQRVSGALIGAFLAPAALFLVWVVAATVASPWESDTGFFTRAGVLVVGLLLSLAAPIAIGMLLSYVVPAFAGGGEYNTAMINQAIGRVGQYGRGGRSAGARVSRSKRASEATDETSAPKAESAATAESAAAADGTAGSGAAAAGAGGAASAGAAGAAGPVGLAAGVWISLVGKVKRVAGAARDTVASGTRDADARHRGSNDDSTGQDTEGRGEPGRSARDRSNDRRGDQGRADQPDQDFAAAGRRDTDGEAGRR